METKTLVLLLFASLPAVVQGTFKRYYYPRPSVDFSVSPTCAFKGDKITLKCTPRNFPYCRLMYIHNGRYWNQYYQPRPVMHVKYRKRAGTYTWQCMGYNRRYKIYSQKRKVHIIERPMFQPKCPQAQKYIVLTTTAKWQGAKNLCACLGYQLWVPASPAELQCVCADVLNNPKLARDFFWLGAKKNGDGYEVGKGQKLVSIFPVETKDKNGQCLSMSFDKFYLSDCNKPYKIICEKGRKKN